MLMAMVTATAVIALAEADKVFGSRDYAAAREKYRACAEQAAEAGNTQVEVEALAQVARCLSLEHKLDDAAKWLERARRKASAAEPLGWSRLLGVRGILERERGDKAAAKRTFGEMFDYCSRKGLTKRALDAIHHIAIVAPPEEQPEWGRKGIALAERAGAEGEGWLPALWNNLGASYEDIKRYDDALAAYLRAQELHHQHGDAVGKLAADWAVGHAYRLLGRHAEARKTLEPTLPAAAALPAPEQRAEWVGWCKKDLGQALVGLGERERGLALLREARASLVECGMDEHWPEGFAAVDAAIAEAEKAR